MAFNGFQFSRGVLGNRVKGFSGRDLERSFFGGGHYGRRRGDINYFSASSCRRLRETLCFLRPVCDAEDWRLYGCCLTIPSRRILDGVEVRRLWAVFRMRFTRRFRWGFVWRVELQTRKQAHFHLVCYARCEADMDILRQMWEDTILASVPLADRQVEQFLQWGVRVDDLRGCHTAGVVAYLCDHTSKHKQSQLGWQGRQWGVVNRDWFGGDEVESLYLPRDIAFKVIRQYRRLCECHRMRGGFVGRPLTLGKDGILRGGAFFGSSGERLRKIIMFHVEHYSPL